MLRGSVGLMHGRYGSPTRCSKLAHHAVCAVRPIIVCLMNYCHATLAIILLSPSVSAIKQFTALKLFTSLSLLLYEVHLNIDLKATLTFTQTS